MDLDTLRDYLFAKAGAAEELPFGPDVLVFKVGGKMFALVAWKQTPLEISLKCDPDQAEFLRERYPEIRPGYHLNKRHWNTITLNGSIPRKEIRGMIDQSYELILSSLPKKTRDTIRPGNA
ncbi:MAG TPA: MmcQ/YjbR family DNA-binding protein [Calditrichia bacterium]|nr:MmcQ/YjbR family DNA-binding protein [Calditrichota bacterium]HQU70972.1 MmcQ/YjbR family DNA-binding protein [Calditrichia bacterium]HQV32448.1 MmcQ/YjbR family DNA-binding protein [Calditrichia bacterium]